MGPNIMTISTIFAPLTTPRTLSHLLLSLIFISSFHFTNSLFIHKLLCLFVLFNRSLLNMMEPTLGLLGGGTGGGGGGGDGVVLTSEQNGLHALKVEKDYLGMSKEGEIELGLGLSLGSGFGVKGKSGRILTAKDFSNGVSANWVGGVVLSSGTKRERASSPDRVEEGGGSVSASASQVVGWPPVRAYRMNTLFNQTKASNGEDDKGVGRNEKKESSNKKINHGSDKNDAPSVKERSHLGYVKVNMDGLPIGRKVDLNAHKSYDTLAKTLSEMFFKSSSTTLGPVSGKEQQIRVPKLLDGSSDFVLTYEDKEGDWMLVGDVPWGMFLNTVKRLKIMRTSEANGLAPKFQESNEKQKCRPI